MHCIIFCIVQLIGTEVDSDFRGFIIQAIRCGDNSSVGTFIEPTDEDSQYKLQCGGVSILMGFHTIVIFALLIFESSKLFC